MYRLLLATLLTGCAPATDSGKDSVVVEDADGDGFTGADDCNSADATINPDAAEVCDDVDNNCDGNVDEGVSGTFYADADGDGYGDPTTSKDACTVPDGYINDGTDCNDVSAAVNPGALEVCNFTDDDCDSVVDDGALKTFFADADDDGYGDTAYTYDACVAPDGYTAAGGDCDDSDGTTFPGAEEEDCTDPIDHNCDGSVGFDDADSDGYAACVDCDDRAAAVNPGALEVCDAADTDEDCDGFADDGDTSATGQTKAWADADGDGHGDATAAVFVCDVPAGSVANSDDCDDGAATAYPGADEVCNDADDDCDGVVDDGVLLTVYVDKDGDGYGTDAYSMEACEVPLGYATVGGDCDDHDAAYNPGALEEDCNDPADYNCDGTVGYTDGDGDGWAACADCDDADPAVNPGEIEICGGADEDCNGSADDADPGVTDQTTVYADTDGDGYGDPGSMSEACVVSDGWVSVAGDCDDTAASTHPSAAEACDLVDNDCDGVVDDGASDASVWYLDYDGDTHGGSATTYVGCSPPSGYVATSDDCDDGDPDNFPGNAEVCDLTDNDCDGTADDGVSPDWYFDGDSDGFGDDSIVSHACTRPFGYVGASADCDDTKDDVYPTATEVCDGYDNDCDALIDDDDGTLDATTGTEFYPDADGDLYGDAGSSGMYCVQPIGWQTTSTDCDDADSGVHPDLEDLCNGVDNDCDNVTDEDGWVTTYIDADGDGAGDSDDDGTVQCLDSGYSANNLDCKDDDPTVTDCDFFPFDGTTGTTWESVKSLSTSGYSLVGYTPSGFVYDTMNFYGSPAQGYTASTNSWTTKSSTNPLGSTIWATAAPYDDKYWWIRGGKVYSYDPATDTFTTVASVTQTETYPMTEADMDGIIYGYSYTGTLIIYNTNTSTASYVSTGKGSLYETRMGYDPTTEAIYFGAYGASALYKYDIATGAITTKTSIPESQLNDIFCSDRAGHIYAAGGSSGMTIYQYTTATDTWAKIPDYPTDHGNNGSCTVAEDGYLYVSPGSTTIYRIALY